MRARARTSLRLGILPPSLSLSIFFLIKTKRRKKKEEEISFSQHNTL